MNPIATNDKQALELFRRAFPETSFRNLTLEAFAGPMSLNSYWDSGYRDYFRILHVESGKTVSEIPQNGTPYDPANLVLSALPVGYALAVHHYAGDRETGTLYFNSADLVTMIPAIPSLTYAEKVVLAVTRSYKPAFRRANAERDCALSSGEYNAAQMTLTNKGLLTATGAITNEGRNVIGFTQPHHLTR